jgi:hypothetical protein
MPLHSTSVTTASRPLSAFTKGFLSCLPQLLSHSGATIPSLAGRYLIGLCSWPLRMASASLSADLWKRQFHRFPGKSL